MAVEPTPEVAVFGARETENNGTAKDVDDAWAFLESHGAPSHVASDEELKVIRRKIDRIILPVLFITYTLQFIDKALLNYAAVMGLREDLNLKGNNFSNAATAFWIAYLVAEPVNSYFLQKVPTAKWFAGNMCVWGVITAAIAGVDSYAGLVVARVFLGITEATIIPSMVLITSQWYTRSEQSIRFAGWAAGVGAGQILGAIISYGFQYADNASLKPWQIMYLVIGLVSAAMGGAALVLLPDTPMVAYFLTTSEKIQLLHHVSANQTGVRNNKFRWSQVLATLKDPQTWLFMLIIALQTETTGVVAYYSSTLIKNMGFTSKEATLLNAPTGVVTIAFTALVGIGVHKTSNRWGWIVFCCIPGIIGGGLMSFLDTDNKAGVLAGIYLINAIIAAFPAVSQWFAANCAGHTKRALTSSLLAAAFSVGSIIGPQTFQARDAPEYLPAKISVLVTQAASAVATVILYLYFKWQNKRRNEDPQSSEDSSSSSSSSNSSGSRSRGIEDWYDLTDEENRRFRYIY